MKSRVIIGSALALLCGSIAVLTASGATAGQTTPAGWILPEDAEQKKNPHPVDQKLIETGMNVYKDKCARCHGPGGLGDGPDADPEVQAEMDLTNPKRAERNPDGVVFYKVWNGRRRPKMPAFNADLTEDQVWAVVAYAQTLRKK
jgi:mono/diheme cytochrome c family protein